MPTLDWIGKEKVINHHLDVPFRVLEHQYGFTEKGEQSEFTGSGNKIIHGDNLDALKALLPEYESAVKCIYIDPPYNTGKENWKYNDNVRDPRIQKWLQETVGKEGEDFTRHDKWLCMMYPRIKLLQRLLHPTGAIIVSIDDNEYAHLKILMDEIFGRQNLLLAGVVNKASEIASAYTVSKHEYFLIYAKSIQSFTLESASKYTLSRGTVGNEKQTTPVITFPIGLRVSNLPDGTHESSRKIENGKENIDNLDPLVVKNGALANEVRMKARWRSSNDMRNFFANNCAPTPAKINGIIEEIYIDGDRFMPFIKKKTSEKITSLYLDNKRGSIDIDKLGMEGKFENPKSVPFIKYFISNLTGKGDIILDSFAGSGTTGQAVLEINAESDEKRKFIIIEMQDYAKELTAERIKRVIKGADEYEGTLGAFDFYELGSNLFNQNGTINELAGRSHINRYIWYTETRAQFQQPDSHNEFLLGVHNHTAYYFYYDEDGITVLDLRFLSTMDVGFRAEQYVIYADACVLPDKMLKQHNIIYKKIPRDISRF